MLMAMPADTPLMADFHDIAAVTPSADITRRLAIISRRSYG